MLRRVALVRTDVSEEPSSIRVTRIGVPFPALPNVLSISVSGPLRLVRINDELLERKSSGSGIEN
jgi:hypothetical protein